MPRRPPKEYMDAAVRAVRARGGVDDPEAVAAAQWWRMSPSARRPWNALRKVREAADPQGDPPEPELPEARRNAAQKAAGRAQATTAARTAIASRAGRAAVAALPGGLEAEAALGVAREVGRILTGDIVVLRREKYKVQEVRVPGRAKPVPMLRKVEAEWHVNPVTIGLGLVGLGVAGFVGLMAWNGVTISSGLGNRTTIAPALKDTSVGKGLVAAGSKAKGYYAIGKATAFGYYGTAKADYSKYTTPPPPPPPPVCSQLKAAYDTFIAGGDSTAAFYVRQDAHSKGCAWAA